MRNSGKYQEIRKRLEAFGQEQLLDTYPGLSPEEQERLLDDVDGIDLELMARLYEKTAAHSAGGEVKADELAPLEPCVESELSPEERERLRKLGLEAIREGKLAVLTMAGGQGTRLGHNGPKGTFDIGLPSGRSLFELHCDRLREVAELAGAPIPWYIMTSELNHGETVRFFEKNGYFGYPADMIRFFPQTMIPPMTPDGKMRLESPGKVLKSPNGNGGAFVSLKLSGRLDEMKAAGIGYLMVAGVDNCLIKMGDPLFLGALIDGGEDAIAKSYLKRGPGEKAGIFCLRNGRPGVVEYTEIPEECATAADRDGNYIYGDCNLLNYVFRMETLDRLCGAGMPYHIAVKKLKYYDPASGERKEQSGCFKFEMFLFDAFGALDTLKVLRVRREDEFAPVKNGSGEDSVELARSMFTDYMKRSGISRI